MGSCWYLEHVSTHERFVLSKGENLIGRHSCCRITLSQIYECVSREHVNIIVSDAGVIVQELNPRNGVFINEQRMCGESKRLPVVEGTVISLGVNGHFTDVPRNYPIFVLRKVATEAEEIVLSSDDDDDAMLVQEMPDLPTKKNTTDQEEHLSCSNMHLPKVPKVQQELVSQTTGEANQAILGTALDRNPCPNNQLNNPPGGTALTRAKLHDGDVIELDMDADKEIMQPPPPPEALEILDDDEYDEHFALSQAVLQDMKAEMAFSDGEEDFILSKYIQHIQDEEQLGSKYDDIIIIDESDDDELNDKVADWSSLLSQKIPDAIQMSQAYPLLEDSGSDEDSHFKAKKPTRSLRIDSSSEDESGDLILCQADSTTTNSPRSRRRCVRTQSATGEVSSTADDAQLSSFPEPKSPEEYKKETSNDKVEAPKKLPSPRLRNRSKSCYMERPIDVNEIQGRQGENKSKQQNKSIAEEEEDCREELVVTLQAPEEPSITEEEDCREVLVVTLHAPEEPKITKAKGNTSSKSHTTPLSREDGKVKAKQSEKAGKSFAPRKQFQKEATKVAEAPVKKGPSSRLLNRSRSFYMERPIDVDAEHMARKQAVDDIKEKQKRHKSIEKDDRAPEEQQKASFKKSVGNKSTKTIHAREEMEVKAKEPKSATPDKKDAVEAVTQVKKGPSPRLLNRSKSCLMDQPKHKDDLVKSPSDAKEAKCTRGPSIIEAPFMSKNRCKFNNNKETQRVLNRQRLIDYQAEMNAKWHQKPKDKKKDDQVIKEKRREALKKLSDKPKEDENSPSSSNANKRKNCTTVPTVSNTNRGEFLTKGIESGPPTKIAKMVEKFKLPTPPAKKPLPKRRSTIESFSQQLLAADELTMNPQPQGSRPPERKKARQARNQRTCNRVSFADLERQPKKVETPQKRVRFCDKVDIKYIEKVGGASKPVRKSKDSLMICLSTHSERREWTLKGNHMVNDIPYHKRTILAWANQWLAHGSVDAVAETDVLMPIPSNFSGFQQYTKTFLPLMRLELLTTIERDYKKNSKTTLDLKVLDVFCENECYHIVAKTNVRPSGKFDLYTLSSDTELAETFACLLTQKTAGGGGFDMTFQIWMQISFEKMKSLKQLTAHPVVDSLRVELGALSAIHQLHRSPLCRRILMPTEMVKTVQMPKVEQALAYKGFDQLNKFQEEICLDVYERVIDDVNPSVTLVQGPPGTGKSILLSNLSLQCLYGRASVMLDRKILICAHSNTAVDHMVKALSAAHSAMSRNHFQLLRFGLDAKINQHSRKFSIEAQFMKARNNKLMRITPENIEIMKKQHCDLKAEIQQLKQKANLMSSYLQHKLEEKQKQLQLLSEQLNPSLTQREEYEIAKGCVQRAHIVCTTLSSCVKLANYVDFFDICIIDEATQCTEPWTLLPMRFGIKHLVLVGDTQQLPAVVLSKKAIDFGLGNSMFDRIQKSLVKHLDLDHPGGIQFVHTKLFKLSTQYRMHPEICRWPNKYFYEGQLVNADQTAKPSALIPYCVVNLSYTRDTSGPNGTSGNRSISNEEEARFVAQLLTEMDKHMPSKRYSYGLISPYSNQCHALSQVIPPHMNLTPQTVDSYQGLERDVIIISNARTRGCGFLANYQRLNVALTRPKRCLIICGNFDDLQSVDMWRQLLDDARQRGVYFDLKREDVSDLQRSLIQKLLVKPL